MPIKIENQATVKIPKKTENTIQSVFEVIPKEHMRGLTKLVLVDKVIPDSRVPLPNLSELPGLYHPKQGNVQPWYEIAVGTLLSADGWFKRIAARLNFKPNLAFLVLSLQAQHYHLTLSHGIKKHQLEGAIRSYTEKYHELWREQQAGWRAKLFKPIRPWLDKWARKLRKRYTAEQKRKSA
ncbi:MAG: hypothetical protein L0Z68_01705 [Gammaproteobacteria bacterium]|nr:hypothetical protein [Gammaproteobacteria bacterium]